MAVRRPQPRMDPTPHAVSANATTITIPSKTRLVSIRGLGPPRMPPTIATATETNAATCGCANCGCARPPADGRRGREHQDQQRQDEPLGASGMTVDVDCVLAGDQNDEDGEGHATPRRRPARALTAGHSRRHQAPGRSTAGRPRSRNHRSAARRCATAAADCVGAASCRSCSEGTVAGYFGLSPRLGICNGLSGPRSSTASPRRPTRPRIRS